MQLARNALHFSGNVLEDACGEFHLLARHIEMRDGADALWGGGVHPHAFIAETGAERGGRAEFAVNFKNDNVRVDDFGVEAQAGRVADRFGEDAGVGVIVGQARHIVLERIERAGGDDAGLAHAAAERFAVSASAADEVGGTAEC